MANKISVILDVATEKAISGLKGFKQSVADADGAFGKVKAGSASAFDSIKANAGIAGVAVVGAVGAMAAKSIEAASRLGESVNAVNVTFGQSAAGIKLLGEEAAESVGLSNAAFNGLAVQFSSFATTIAGEGGNVVQTIDDMTTRAADFASVMNLDVADAATIFQSGLAGETEPLKKFGIDLSAASVEAYALANGIIESGESMTEAQKVQARYGSLMEQTAKTSGDFANTSDGLANSQRILAAKMEDTAAKVGKDLAPALAIVTTVLSDLIPIAGTVASGVGGAFVKMTDQAYAFGKGIADMVDALPFVDLAESVGPTLYEWEKLERATADLVTQFSEGAPTMAEFKAKMEASGHSVEEVALATIEYRKQLDGTHDATGAVIEVTDDLTEAVDRTAAGQAEADAMIAQVNATYAAQVEAVDAAAEALEELTQDQIDAVGSAFNLESATLNLESAYATYEEQLLANIETQNNAEISDRDKEISARDLRQAELDVADSALATAEAYAAEMGAADGSAESAQLQKDKLYELMAAFPELRGEIQLYIDKLNAVPGVIRTAFEITATGATVTPHGDLIGLPAVDENGNPIHRVGGGTTRAGGLYEVTEAGSEVLREGGHTYLLAAANGYITPHNAIAGGWPAGSNVAGGDTYNATVNNNGRDVGVADIGRALTLARLSR